MDFNIIGIVGPFASGKGVVTDYLIKKYKYKSFSLSSIVHDEVKKKGIVNYNRTILQNTGDELREKEGDGVLAKRAIKQLTANNKRLTVQKIVIEGIRNPGEVEYLRSIPGFFLIAVNASQKIRFERILKRNKPWDPKDWEAFIKVDGRDSEDKKNTNGQQVKKCMEMADVEIKNEGGVKEVVEEVEKILRSKHISK
jgi:dephospho-CoA kinase